jgi:hypothetical protein
MKKTELIQLIKEEILNTMVELSPNTSDEREWEVYFEYMDKYEDIYDNDEVPDKRADLKPENLKVKASNETNALELARDLIYQKRPWGWKIFNNRVKVKPV